MKRKVISVLLLGALLSGCGFADGSYVSVTPHQEQRQSVQQTAIYASNYQDLTQALQNMVASGMETGTILVPEYPADAVQTGMAVAIRHVCENDPLGAYAVESISYEQGNSGGQPAVAVQIRYLHSRGELRRIRQVESQDQASGIISKALENCEPGVVMLVQEYIPWDFTQMVENLAQANPHLVMEQPQVSVGVYGNGKQRVVELIFTYQTGRDSLRQMQSQVKPVFDAAVLYVSADASQWQKYSQLYAFLMERFDYTIETSITPAYSLLHHGVGDSRAFATVYAAMCRDAGLECLVVRGTREGEPWVWNMVLDNGYYYHVDLLRCSSQGRYSEKTDSQMQGYVWDYSAFPACTGPGRSPGEESSQKPTEPTQPETQPEAGEQEPVTEDFEE